MLSSATTTDMECKKKSLNSGGSSSSSSSSTMLSSSTPSHPFPHSFSHQTTTPVPPNNKSMEHVWKHINHAPPLCNDHTTLPNITPTALQPFTLTIAIAPPPPTKVASATSSPLATAMSLSFSRHSHTQLHLVQPHRHHHKLPSNVEALISNTNPFQNMACSSDSLSTLGRKRFLDSISKSGDTRKKRMMKNRESAARSRARKQAYTCELQQKLNQLMEENARLKRQHRLLGESEANRQTRKRNLYRTSTAPF